MIQITWNNAGVKEHLQDVDAVLLSLGNCRVSVDRYGFSTHCIDTRGERISWGVLEANSLVYLLNRAILHKAGYHLYLMNGVSPGFFLTDEDEFCYTEEQVLRHEEVLHSLFGEKYQVFLDTSNEGA